ncbi:Fur family transcriptional regulator [Granulicella arctica]|uniref:Fur family transcriptional regulator n=1 Tax=Granulicella arctica TaxID=940613 RepID=UPI0021E06433|nr:transcriptional repressor [Granulicella arctica]
MSQNLGHGGSTFRDVCAQHGIAMTHQRQVLYEVMQGMAGHPSPEEIFAEVRRRIPAISLATVYKNIHIFVENGILREVSLHHGSQRLEISDQDHYHLVCSRCKAITDITAEDIELIPKQKHLGVGFLVERYSVDVIGLCARCQHSAEEATRVEC